jgi:hypothetical protein
LTKSRTNDMVGRTMVLWEPNRVRQTMTMIHMEWKQGIYMHQCPFGSRRTNASINSLADTPRHLSLGYPFSSLVGWFISVFCGAACSGKERNRFTN